jgi:hypothetical protein
LTSTHNILDFGLLQDGYVFPEGIVGEEAELDETNRISANGNSTLCTLVIVPGSGYHVQPLSQVVQIHTRE